MKKEKFIEDPIAGFEFYWDELRKNHHKDLSEEQNIAIMIFYKWLEKNYKIINKK